VASQVPLIGRGHISFEHRAAAALVIGFACGFALGFGRIMQGAHFLSHNLWAAWVCWMVALALWALILEPDSPPSPQTTARHS
jgi:membrane-associated PAP2 superfamily phosphatase